MSFVLYYMYIFTCVVSVEEHVVHILCVACNLVYKCL